MSSPIIWNGSNAKALTNDILINNANFEDLRIGNQISQNASTGIVSGGVLAVNADTTKFDLSAGSGQIINYSTPSAPTLDKVSWNAFTAQTVTGLASQDETYILIDSTGAITQQSGFPTPTQRRAKIFIGRLGHSSRTFINFATSFPDYGQSVGSQMFDLYDALGPFNINGNQILNNGAALSFQKTAGSMFFRSFNYPTSSMTPSYVSSPSATPQTFYYRTQTALDSTPRTLIDPLTYDVAGTATAIPGALARATIQRVYLSPNGTVQIQYGQTFYSNLTEAIANIGAEVFITNPTLVNTSILIGYIVVQKNCAALNDTTRSAILRGAKFETGAGGGVNTVTSLQQTYNSSTQPQIVLTSALGGVQVFDNATPLGSGLFQVANNAGTTNYLNVSATSVATKIPLALSGSSSGTITVQTQAAAGTFNWNLPTSAGTTGQVLISGGGGASPMTWSDRNNTGAIGLQWVESTDSPIASIDLNVRTYIFEDAISQALYALVRVPAGYVAGKQIKLRITPYSKDAASTTMLIQSIATLIRTGTDALTSTTNQRTSTNTAISIGAGTVNIPQTAILDLTDTSGAINSVAVSAGDMIQVKLQRDFVTDTSTQGVYVPVYSSEVTFNA